MGKVESNKGIRSSFLTEGLLFVLFVILDVLVCVFGYEEYLGLSILIVGLLSLFLNDLNKVLDLFFALMWSALYAYFCYHNGFLSHAVLVSLCYLITKIMNLFTKKSDKLVEQKKRLKGHQYVAIIFILIGVSVGSYFMTKVWQYEVLGLVDAISATVLCLSLFIKSSKYEEYFIIRLLSMILVIALWAIKGFLYGFITGVASCGIMFIAFLIFDNVRIYRYSNEKPIVLQTDEKDDILDSEEYKAAAKKYNQENPNGLPSKSIGVDKDNKRK